MITPEEFEVIVNDLRENVLVSQDTVRRLVGTIAELDQQNAIIEGAVHYTLAASEQLFLNFGAEIAGIIGIRDMGKKRKIASSAGAAAAQLRAAVQLFVQGMVEEANNVAQQSLAVDGLDEVTDDETTASPVVGGDQ